MTELDADTLTAAYKKWTSSIIESISNVRLEIAKFFFGVSTATMAFFITAWQIFHSAKEPMRAVDVLGLTTLAFSVLWSLVIFWPISYNFQNNLAIEPKYLATVKRVKIEGALWALLWLSGLRKYQFTINLNF